MRPTSRNRLKPRFGVELGGHVSLLAARDLDVAHDITTDTTYERFFEVKRSWFSKRVTDITKTSSEETANPSDISGRSVSIGAGGNVNIVGSLVMADGAVGLHADQDLNLLATSESSYAYESRSVSKSGIFGNGVGVGGSQSGFAVSGKWLLRSWPVQVALRCRA